MGVNGKRDKTRNIIFQRKTRKAGKTGENTHKKQGKKQEKEKITRNKETRRDKISARQDFGKTRFREMLKKEMRTKTMSS